MVRCVERYICSDGTEFEKRIEAELYDLKIKILYSDDSPAFSSLTAEEIYQYIFDQLDAEFGIEQNIEDDIFDR